MTRTLWVAAVAALFGTLVGLVSSASAQSGGILNRAGFPGGRFG